MNLKEQELLKPIKDFYEKEGRAPYKYEIANANTIAEHFGNDWARAVEAAGLKPHRKKLSNEEMIKMIRDFYEKEGRVPGKREIEKFTQIINRFGSWTNAVKAAGLEPTIKFWTKESILERLEEWYEEKRRYPKYSDLKKENNLFDHKVFQHYFGQTYNSYMAETGKLDYSIRLHYAGLNDMSDVEVLKLFENEINRINTNNFNVYKNERSEKSPSAYYLTRRFNCTWNDLLQMIGKKGMILKLDKEETIQLFKEYMAKYKHVPTFSELEAKARDIYNGIQLTWSSYTAFCEEIGVEPPFVKSDAVTASDEELLKMYYDFYLKLGRTPTSKDLDRSDEIYSYDIYSIRFGEIDNVRRLAGVPELYRSAVKVTKDDVERELLNIYKNHGRVTNKQLQKLLPFSVTTVCRKYKTTKLSEVWAEIEEKAKTFE